MLLGTEDSSRPVEKAPQTYLEWNDALASNIFRPEMAGREVFLFVNDDLIEQIGGAGSIGNFVSAVEQGAPWVEPHLRLCQKALRALKDWRGRGLRYPPYVGYLSLFVLAVGLEGDFASHSYYPRLRTLLGWSDVDAGAPPSFDQMLSLWEDLEVWSNQDMGGALGVFSIRIAGEWIHVGLPKAQAVLTEQERTDLREIFAASGFDPTAPPPDAEIARALRRHGVHLLRARTLELLAEESSEPDLFAVLLDAVRGELEEWDGESSLGDEGDTGVTALARICLRVDEIARRAVATLRIAAHADFPEDGLRLESADGSIRLTCEEYVPQWSSPLRDPSTKRDADASKFDWSEALVLADSRAGWRVRLPGSRVRILVSGLPLELPGLVEVRGLQRRKPFYLVASDATIPALAAWAASGEVNLDRIQSIDGLPLGWTLFRSSGASDDTAIRKVLPELALPTGIRLRLDGGIRSGQGNTYFKFAPPAIVLEGASGDEEVVCEGRPIYPLAGGSGAFGLPANLPAGARITVEVKHGGDVLRRQSLFLSDLFDWNMAAALFSADRLGAVREPPQLDADDIAGALGSTEPVAEFPVRPDLRAGRRIFIVGRRPGEIRSFPAQDAPAEWDPVWLIELDRHGRAEYCGLDLARSRPGPDTAGTSDDRALWKDVLWHRRMRIEPPSHPKLGALWREYVQAAARV